MSYGEPDGRGDGPSNRLIAGAAVVALLVVIAAVVVILTRSSGGGSSSPTTAARTSGTGAATVTAPHILSTSTATSPTSSTSTSSTSSASTTGPQPAGGPVPSGFEPQSFTAVSDTTWWLLGDAPCSSPPCESIVRSVNGGRSWVGIPAPRTSKVTDLRFADARNGFAFGQQLWSTHNGGATWRQVPLSGSVRDLTIAGGYVYVATTQALLRATAGSDSFGVVHAGDVSSVWAQGAQVLADEIAQSGDELLSSDDSGGSFIAHAAPVASVACQFATTGGEVLWAQCASGTLGGVWRSSDGGGHWTAVSPKDGGDQPNGAALAVASQATAVYGYNQVFRTTDGGTNWSTVSGLGAKDTAVSYLGFSDPEHGVAIVTSEAGESTAKLEVTRDGGASYAPVSISPG